MPDNQSETEGQASSLRAEVDRLRALGWFDVAALFTAIAHGDDEHRAWLLAALRAYRDGKPFPAPPASPDADPMERARGVCPAQREMCVAPAWRALTECGEQRAREARAAAMTTAIWAIHDAGLPQYHRNLQIRTLLAQAVKAALAATPPQPEGGEG